MAIDVVEVKRRLLSLLNDTNLVNEYLRQFGPTLDIKHIKSIKDARACERRTRPGNRSRDDPGSAGGSRGRRR